MNYEKFINERAKNIKPSGIRKFFEIVEQRKDVISLGVGEPDFDTPWGSREAAVRSIRKGMTHYTSNYGLLQLRELISEYYKKRYNCDYDCKSEILTTTGASEAIDLALRAVCENGDEILIPEPSYVSYCPCVVLAGANPVAVKCNAETEFKLVADELEKYITDKTKALILPYPNNPTGAIMERKYLEKVAETAIKHDILIISDEIYSELTYNEEGHTSIASLPNMKERTIVINGFSKAFAMTGWRLGYVLAPKELLHAMYKIHQYTMLCAPTISQYAGIESLKQGFEDDFTSVTEMRDQYDMRRRFVVKELNSMGLKCFTPRGAFYVFPCLSSLGMTGEEFASRLLEEECVAVVPGSAFGESGEYFVRISYAYSMKNLEIALQKIADFVKKIKSEIK